MEIWKGRSMSGESSIDCWEGVELDPELFNNDSKSVSGMGRRRDEEEEREKEEDRR